MLPTYVPASGGDDTANLNAALLASGNIVLGASETYQVSGLLTIPKNGRIAGQGRSTLINKIAACDMIDMKEGAEIHDLRLSGGTFNGRGIVLRSGEHYQRIINTHIDATGYCVECEATDAGSHLTIDDCFITRTNANYSIKLPDADASGGNRTIRNVRSSGGYGVDAAGARNTQLERVNMAYIHMGAASITVQLLNSRIGYAEWRGHSHWVMGNNVGLQNFITPDCYQSMFIWGPMNQALGRQDPAANANVVI